MAPVSVRNSSRVSVIVAVLPAGLQVEEEQAQGLHLVHGVVLPVVVVVAQVYDGLALHIDVDVVVDLAAGRRLASQSPVSM